MNELPAGYERFTREELEALSFLYALLAKREAFVESFEKFPDTNDRFKDGFCVRVGVTGEGTVIAITDDPTTGRLQDRRIAFRETDLVVRMIDAVADCMRESLDRRGIHAENVKFVNPKG